MEDPHSLKSNEMAECSFAPQQPLVADTFKNCEGLSRVAFMDGNGVVAWREMHLFPSARRRTPLSICITLHIIHCLQVPNLSDFHSS